jgi:DNA invertase Pin-like site-specific DNA recombinase
MTGPSLSTLLSQNNRGSITAAAVTALGYVRRSKASDVRTVSLEDQQARIADYCRSQGWTLAEVLVDDGVSGGRRDRLQRIQAALRRHRASVVVCYHLDRVARDVAALLDTLKAWSRRGVELHVVGRGRIEAETASGLLMTGIEGLLAEHYRKVVSEKTRDALARLRAKGRRVSRFPPYGFTILPGSHLIPDPKEQAVLAEIFALSAAGRSLRGIARELLNRGIMARTGRPFGPQTLAQILRRRTMAGAEGVP